MARVEKQGFQLLIHPQPAQVGVIPQVGGERSEPQHGNRVTVINRSGASDMLGFASLTANLQSLFGRSVAIYYN